MSDSIPKPAPAADESLAPGLPPSAASPRWWIASLAFHGVLLAWLVFFSPVRVFDPNAKPAARQVSADRAREVVEQIRETQADSLEQNLRSLEDIRGKIAELENRKRTEFAAFAREMGKDAPAKAAAEQQTIAQAQAEALAALDKAGENAAHFVQTRAGAFFDDVADAQKLAREQQTRILQMQEQAQAVLSLGGDRFASARDAQAGAAAAQDRAAKALVEAEAARDAARAGRKRTAREGQIEHFSYHLRRAKDGVVNADKNLATWKKELTIAEAVTAATGAAAAEAAKKAAADPDATAQAAAATAQKAVERAERELADARKRVDEAPKTLEAARKNLPELEAKVAELLATPEPEPVAATPEDGKFIEVQAAARQLQLTAQEAQAKAAQAIAAIRDTNGGDGSGAAALADLDKAAPSEPAPPAADTGHMNLAQIYERAVQNEGALTQSYRRLRATDLAMIRRLPLAKAVQLTEVAKVIRPDLKEALQASVESGEDVAAAREAVQTAKGEISAIVRLASSLLSQAQGIDRSEGSTVSTEEYNTQFEQWEKMQTLAAEDEGAWAKDLTAAMEGGEGAAGEGKPGGEAGDGTAGGADGAGAGTAGGGGAGGKGAAGAGSGRPGGTGAAAGAAGAGAPDLGKSGIAGPFGGGAGSGAAGASGGEPGGPGGFGKGGIAGARGAFGAPEDVSQRVFPFPGRRIAARGPSAKWFFADSWYILGPFDNTRRGNIERKFPPETIIDLNATYPGKNGVPIHWEFHQSGKPNVMPPMDAYNAAVQDPSRSPAANYESNLQYVIYYAYTELWFERACDLWVAIGSDDFSKVWIEDQLVWSSGKNLKAWKLNEGLRKVHFKQGINRVLYRVENANNKTEFSLVVSLQP